MMKAFVHPINNSSIVRRFAIAGCILAASLPSAAQLYIGPGAQIQITGNATLALNDMNFVNNGTFSAGNSTVSFLGAGNVSLSGSQPLQFYTIQINKDQGSSVMLQRPVSLSNEVQFLKGFIDLNKQNLDLGSTGWLIGESENSRIIGAAGGEVIITNKLNAPSKVNPGNLGAQISSPRDLGSVTIKRGHQVQNLASGNILRYYNISPDNNSDLGATLRFYYFDAELNGLSEKDLVQWSSSDGSKWVDQKLSTRDITQNYVEQTGIKAFSLWTLSTPSDPLPVVFTDFYLRCDGDRAILRWKTAQEINSSHFNIERNSGTGFISIGKLSAAGNSSTEKSYEFIDLNPAENAQYRIAQYDLDGQVKYTPIVIFHCTLINTWKVWPNPFGQVFTVKIPNDGNGQARLRVIDSKGAEIINRPLILVRGANQFEVNLQKAASGIYLLIVEWMDGQQVKTMRLIKQ